MSVESVLLVIAPTECIRCRDVFVVTVVIIVELDGVPFRHEWCMGIRWLPAGDGQRDGVCVEVGREEETGGQRVI